MDPHKVKFALEEKSSVAEIYTANDELFATLKKGTNTHVLTLFQSSLKPEIDLVKPIADDLLTTEDQFGIVINNTTISIHDNSGCNLETIVQHAVNYNQARKLQRTV